MTSSKNKLVLIFFASALAIWSVSGCSNRKGDDGIPFPEDQAAVPPPQRLFSDSVVHFFSDTTAADTFRIDVTGPSMVAGTFTFQIISHTGDVLLSETLPTTYLLDFNAPDHATPAQQEAYMMNRLRSFFVPQAFRTPAIRPSEKPDGDPSREQAWREIQADPSATGFIFLTGKENARRIAYSKRSGRVVVYFNCC